MSEVVEFPKKSTSVDSAMHWLNDMHKRGTLMNLVVIAADTDGSYDVAMTKMSANIALFMTTYLREQVMCELRDAGAMPIAD